MAKAKPITHKDLTELSDAILGGIEQMMDQVEERNASRFEKLSNEIDALHKYLDRLVEHVVSRREFNDLKEKVYRHHPVN